MAINASPLNQQTYGWFPGAIGANASISLSATATWLALGFYVPVAKTLSKVRIYTSGINGTLADGNLSCDIFSDSAGSPGASLQSSTTVTGGHPTGAGWVEFTGFTQALTPGTQYWAVFKNGNGTPASNFPVYRWSPNMGGGSWPGSTSGIGWGKWQSANSGSSWVTSSANVMGLRLEFSDGTFAGFGFEGGALDTTNKVFSTNEVGAYFTTPAHTKLNVIGIAMLVAKASSPTGTPRFKLYEGTTLIATTTDIAAAQITTTGQSFVAFFSSVQTLKANTVYRVTLAESTQSDSSSNVYETWRIQVDSDANSQALKPFNGTSQQTVYNGSTWSQTSTQIVPFLFILDQVGGEFSSNSGTITAGQIKVGDVVTVDGADITGTYDGTDRWTALVESTVKINTAYKSNSLTNNKTGTYNGSDLWSDPGDFNVSALVEYLADGVTMIGTREVVTNVMAEQVLTGQSLSMVLEERSS